MIQHCSNYQYFEPANAASVSVTPNGTANANSSWVTVFTADADCVLTEVISYQPGTTNRGYRVDVGVSVGGGAETVIGTATGFNKGLTTPGFGRHPFRIPIDAIPNGAVVKVRMRKGGTDTTAWHFSLGFYKKPIVGTIQTTANPQIETAIATVVPNNSVWTNGSWANIHTFAADSVISGYTIFTDPMQYILELGISSTPIWTSRGTIELAEIGIYRLFKNPLHVASGATVQGRVRKGATGTPNVDVGLSYYELPL